MIGMSAVYACHLALLCLYLLQFTIWSWIIHEINTIQEIVRKIYPRLVVVSQASKSSHVLWVSTSYTFTHTLLNIAWLKKIIGVIGVLTRTVVSDWRFDNLCGSHLQSQVVVLVSGKFKNPCERFDWSVDRVAVGKCVMWLAVKTCEDIGYANRWDVKWIINKVLLFPVE